MSTAEIRHFHLFAGLGGGARGFNRRSGTCDRHLCASCATVAGPDRHLCPDHAGAEPPAQADLGF